MQKLLYIQVLRSPILVALLHGTPAASISQTLRCGTRNGIAQLLQRPPPIFGWAAIMLGIDPHSGLLLFCHILMQRTSLGVVVVFSNEVCILIKNLCGLTRYGANVNFQTIIVKWHTGLSDASET